MTEAGGERLGLGEPEAGEGRDEPVVGTGSGSGILYVFGRQLKLFRERAGLERPEFGQRTGYSASTVASFEQGRRIPPPKFIGQADEVLDAGGVLCAMREEVARARYPRFFQDFVRLEQVAVELHVYDTHVINGLLQTEEYARAVFTMRRPLLDQETIDQRVAARLERQEIFSRWPGPLMSFVIEEAVLRRRLGGGGVQRGQLEQLLLTGQKRNVEIQVMPLDREEHAGLSGPFTLMETSENQRVAYVEVQNVSRLHTDRKPVRELEAQYGIIRAEALTPRESLAFIEKLLGEL